MPVHAAVVDAAGSPFAADPVNAVVSIAGNGGRDYEGNALYNGAPDIGAFGRPGGGGSVTRYEAEASPAVCTGTIDANWAGYSASGFCNGDSAVGAYAQFSVNASTAGTATVQFANGSTADRPADLVVNVVGSFSVIEPQ